MNLRKVLSAITPLLALFPVFGIGQTSPSSTSYPCDIVGGQVVVTDCGATGNGNATGAIQRANNTIAADGGGRVVFPAGTYNAASVFQDSHVEFYGEPGAKIVRLLDSPHSLIRSRVQAWIRGSMASGSSTVTGLSKVSGMEVGTRLAVLGAAGGSDVQKTTLSIGAPFATSPIRLRDASGFESSERNYLLIDDEVISYTGITGNTLTGVQRGLFGTWRVAHSGGAPISQLRMLYGTITSISGTSATLDRSAVKTVKSAWVWSGASDLKITGLELDGNPPAMARRFTFPLQYHLARNVSITGSTFTNGEHGAISLSQGTSDSLVEGNDFHENASMDSATIWLFQSSERNVLRGNAITDTGANPSSGIRIDDRTATTSYWDGPGSSNVVEGNTISTKSTGFYTMGVSIEGSSSNRVQGNRIDGANAGVQILQGLNKGRRIDASTNNVIEGNTFVGQTTGVNVNGDDNRFITNTFVATYADCRDDGVSNEFTGNVTDKPAFSCA